MSAISGGGLFSKRFSFRNGGISLGVDGVFAHGLGEVPKLVDVWIKCATAEYGYSVGDIVMVASTSHDSGAFGLCVQKDATNIRIVWGNSGFLLVRKDTHQQIQFTAGNWKIEMDAYA